MSDKKKVIYADELRKLIVEDKLIRGTAFVEIMQILREMPEAKVSCPCCGARADLYIDEYDVNQS